MLRNKADIRTLLFMAFTTGLIFFQWSLPEANPWLVVLGCLMAISITTLAHNHNHVQTWSSPFLNKLHDYWLTLLYGYPTFAWIPTHNMNHHVYTNREPDNTATYKVGEGNNLFTLLIYPTFSGKVQQRPNFDYMRGLFHKDRARWVHGMIQITLLLSLYAVTFWLDWKKALLYVFIPHQVGLNMVLIFNYIQHVHTDEFSDINHSRNFVSPLMNWFLFNNGYHTVHHLQPLKHWSTAKAAHQAIAHKMDPALNEPSILWYFARVYFLGILVPSFRTQPMRTQASRLEAQEAIKAGRPVPAGRTSADFGRGMAAQAL